MHPIARKIKTTLNNPKVLSNFLIALYVSNFWSISKKDKLLSTWHNVGARSRIEQFAFEGYFKYWYENIYLKELNPEIRESMKKVCMGGDSGVNWAEVYDANPIDKNEPINDLSFDEAMPWYACMEKQLKETTKPALIVQVGSSSGREIAYFSNLFPHLNFIGTDIDSGIVLRAKKKYAVPNISFSVAMAHEIGEILSGYDSAIIYSNGSLQYVQPEHLAIMFKIIKKNNASIILGEPWTKDGISLTSNLTRNRGNFSFSHDYNLYAKNAGLNVITYEVISPYSKSNIEKFDTKHFFLHAA